MPFLVADTAEIMCDMGDAPDVLIVEPGPPHTAISMPMPLAVVTDFAPGVNITTFGMCNSPANPAVIAATAAASGVFTPAPCVPAIVAPWDPPASVLLDGVAAFDEFATCECMWEGTVLVTDPGQASVVTAP
ncbi:MAG: DUF4280 domain-containing protein [Solirubrobacterales bacterium]|nr:DUF4280 domain-containing protein [Solirubrobacterales bacterium]MBV8944761.1 DUF4280 domain-containing protein [Solirubrobacterales bacterium]MBV9365357.1 DUF4280 domain-containing protein [Solirubrobacterales bacterium]MBV9680477.1 DUF4280 domain-containing protein [Solirubrobacterales bacterium]MBV9805967.1 DUF4280 domain-containing protein [Solirubrobacterales bacterium]